MFNRKDLSITEVLGKKETRYQRIVSPLTKRIGLGSEGVDSDDGLRITTIVIVKDYVRSYTLLRLIGRNSNLLPCI